MENIELKLLIFVKCFILNIISDIIHVHLCRFFVDTSPLHNQLRNNRFFRIFLPFFKCDDPHVWVFEKIFQTDHSNYLIVVELLKRDELKLLEGFLMKNSQKNFDKEIVCTKSGIKFKFKNRFEPFEDLRCF